ncbi:CBASS cGAMP-activated phospholipase [Flagellimonas nanhaiensis]|uniref:Patatin n=1 Tax=Flagellimonas nanhaiensis TaxID=2292706 RepID=A0A371JLR0_9FLAO|nr:CBASS cGAMP-activated phospholipase [Allomuricauda nanhaiensis]RDY57939.1 patatin [Allomuricauda nanhaiensis]
MKKPFKILSIDGGGIKGLYSSKILEHFEQEFQCNVVDHFDMICGTSTGGILGLALSLKIKAEEISRMYEENGEKIFPNQSKLKGKIKQSLLGGKYSDKPLRSALEATFGDHKIKDSHCLLCIPSYSVTDARPFIFKYDHEENKQRRDNNAKYVDVALATSAAPTYFPLAEIEYYNSRQFIDGGIYANNPSIVGLIEALDYFVGEDKEYDEVQILSISSLNNLEGEVTGLSRKRSFLHWQEKLFEAILTGQAKFVDYFMRKASESDSIPVKHVRVPSDKLSPTQQKIIKLDKATKKSINMLRIKGNDMGLLWRKKSEIREFFETKKTYKTN